MSDGGTVDLGQTLARAEGAACRGDVDALEAELRFLRNLRASGMAEIGTRLRAVARSVRMHPSFCEVSARTRMAG